MFHYQLLVELVTVEIFFAFSYCSKISSQHKRKAREEKTETTFPYIPLFHGHNVLPIDKFRGRILPPTQSAAEPHKGMMAPKKRNLRELVPLMQNETKTNQLSLT